MGAEMGGGRRDARCCAMQKGKGGGVWCVGRYWAGGRAFE
jgi:hypothetical protein